MKTLTIRQMVMTAMMTAIMCVLAPLSIPIGPVPISLATFIVYLSAYVLGPKLATLSVLVYLILGFVGVPVFAGYTGGAAKIMGPTGGYLVGYIFLAAIAGYIIHRSNEKPVLSAGAMLIGTLVLYTMGTAWLMYSASMDLPAALMAGMIPFIPGDIAKIVAALVIGPKLSALLVKAGVALEA